MRHDLSAEGVNPALAAAAYALPLALASDFGNPGQSPMSS